MIMNREDKEDWLCWHWVGIHASHVEIRDDINNITGHFMDESVENLLEPLSDSKIDQLMTYFGFRK